MSMVSLYTLPPNVKGKIRDFRVKIELRKISGPKGKAINFVGSSGGINVKFIWWGESQANGAVIKYQERTKYKENISQSSATIEYAVLTNIDLFRNYLGRCEPIEVQLTSSTSNLQLGTAFVRIPTRLSNLDLESFEETVKNKIFSPRNVYLGDITLDIGVLFGKSLNSARSTTSTGSKNSCLSEKLVKEKIPATFKMLDIVPPRAQSRFGMSDLDSARSFKSFREKYSTEHKDTREVDGISRPSTSNRSVVDYLSGCPMSRKEEELALDEIRCISPLTLVTDIVSSRIRSSKSSAKDILGKIDSLRLGVKYLKINSAGIREIATQSLAQATFTIECRISPNLLDNVRARYDYDVMRFYSDNFDDCDKRVDFNRDALRSIRISRNEYITDSSNVGVEQAHLLFSIWWREFGTKHSRCLGTTQFRFTTLLATNELEQTKKLAVKSCLGDITVGYLIAKVTLGTKGVHFGPDFLAFYDDNESNPRTPFQDSSSSIVISSFSDLMESPKPRTTPTSSNQDKGAANDKSGITINRGDSGSSQGLSSESKVLKEANDNVDRNNDEKITQKTQDPKSGEFKLLQGLLFVGRLRNVQPLTDGGYFLVCHAFWKEDVTSTDFCRDDNFNFLEIFPIMNDNKFLDRARNNHLTLELWQKTQTTKEQMVGVVKLPLHQFFIAFRDATITNHLSQIKLPVISIDGWVPVASPLAGETCGQLQTLLAIGTEEQLEYLKASRSGLSFNTVSYLNHEEPNLFHVPVPQIPGNKVNDKCKYNASCDAGSQTSFDGRRERLSDLLGTFIDNLAQQLPQERLQMPAANNPISEKNSFSLQTATNPNVGNQIRKTADLLDVLQQALVTPPLTNLCASSNMFKQPVACPQENQPSPIDIPLSTFKILLEIENALHLPRNRTKIGNKKNMKRNSVGAKCKQPRFPADEEPSAYVTFQAEEGYGPMIKSHEGLVYATNIVEKSCNPVWNKRFEIVVPVDLFVNDEKRFILKIWRKAATDSTHSGLVPSPLEDSVIGFSAVDLNVLLAGLPCISGWFNVVDFNGRINGQIKVNVRPLDDIQKIKNLSTQTPLSSYTSSNDTEHQYSVPLPDDGINKSCPTGLDLNNSSLSRAIKRKFTELEEITQRLKARLFDVTGEPESLDTTNIEDQEVGDEQLDEFERDLNTVCEEEDDAVAGEIQDRNNFGWLGFIPNEFNSSEFGHQSSEGGSSLAIGNDSQERIQVISESLKNADLNACVLKDLQSTSSKFDGGDCGMGTSCTKFTKNQSV